MTSKWPVEYELVVRVQIREPRSGDSGLTIQEEATVRCETFLEVAKILGMFHDLTETIKTGRIA